MGLITSGTLQPIEFVEALVKLDPKELSRAPFGPLLLVVRVPLPDDGGFTRAFRSSVLRDVAPYSTTGNWLTTSEFPTLRVEGSELDEGDQLELLAELAGESHCLAPLLATRDAPRLRVGRAPESELLFSDPSVSAHHAELIPGDGGVRVRDLGSKNGTRHNGRVLSLGDEPWLQPMDRIGFGGVDGFVCDPRALRAVLRQELRVLI